MLRMWSTRKPVITWQAMKGRRQRGRLRRQCQRNALVTVSQQLTCVQVSMSMAPFDRDRRHCLRSLA